jgi:TRAP-type C4-dicarboxylate transport system substrate-binding protein
LIGLISIGGPTAALAQTVDMKVGFVTINDSQHESAKVFAEEIAKRTKGAIQARIFPAGQLGNIGRQIEGLSLGTQEAFITPPGFMVGLNPAFSAADAPGLFESGWHQMKALNHPLVRDKFMALGDHANIAGLYLYSAGYTGIASRAPIRNLNDIKGLKLRVLASKVEVAFVGALGATGVPMDFTEVLPAIQNRTLDGTRIGVIVLSPSRFYTAAKYIYAEQTGEVPAGFWLSKGWLTKLSADHRKAVLDLGRDMTERTQLIAIELLARTEKVWLENGGEITQPTPADRAELNKRARAVSDEVLGTDPKVKEMYKLMKQAAEATRGSQPPKN